MMSRILENTKKCSAVALILITGHVLVGCATVTGGTSQSIEVNSDPEGATVTFTPSGETLVTPAVIELDRSTDHVAVFRLDGHDEVRLRINRAPRGALYGSALIPVLGVAALAIDAATDAEFNLYPDPIDVALSLSNSQLPKESEATTDGRIVVFNRNTVADEIYFAFDGAEPCKLKKWHMTSVELSQGPHDLTVYHWDVFKFSDDYEFNLPEGVRFVGVFSGVGSTNFSYYDELPTLKKEFKEISCHSDGDAQGTTEEDDPSDSESTG